MLAEFAVACAIGGMVLSVLPAFYLASTKLWQRESSEIGAREQSELAIVRVKKELRNARSTTISSEGKTLTLVLPAVSGSCSSAESTAVFNAEGQLIDGDRVDYYFQAQSGSAGGSILRRVTHSDGSSESPRPVADHVYPQLNPLRAGGGSLPVFSFNNLNRTVTVTVTASQPKASRGSFAAKEQDPRCARCGAALVRSATPSHPEGVITCTRCGARTLASAEVVTHQATLLLRNR
jgi:Tfp pilus assembly protein PilW